MNQAEEISRLRKIIASREKTIEQLSVKSQWLDLIFDHAPINIYIKNSSGRFVAVNKEFEKNFSISSAEIVDNFPLHLSESELKMAQEHDQRIFDSGVASEQEETIGNRVYRVIKYPVFDSDGKPAQIIGFDVDITDLNRIQKELLEHNRDLEAFSYTVAHDLKAPARRIKAFTEILVREQHEQLSHNAFELLEYIGSSAELLTQLVDDLLKISRLGTGSIQFELLDIMALLNAVRQEVIASQDSQQEDAIQVTGTLPELEGQYLSLKLIFQNLFENGLKFVAPGVLPCIVVTTSVEEGCCTIAVRDNGIGIPAEHQEEIFGTFKRLHSSDTYPGTGIGLAIVKKGVKIHNGSVKVDSEPGHGSTFFVRLPLSQPKR